MEQIQGEGGYVVGFGHIRKRSVLGCGMSRNGIRSLVIVMIVMTVLWSAVVINIMHFAGVFNG
ncbi:TPA: hypothetical protein OUF01_000742 [Klebsiella michiganensis]|nr:hypothetical protein [Klebsiella michiganensis]HCU0557026.1 hypothetical protein [Klebsiella michiganensis]HCU0675017.1 hypothetical protein [Klebsiella michiganensis]